MFSRRASPRARSRRYSIPVATKSKTKKPAADPSLPKHIVDAIRRAWPTGVVESRDSDDDDPLLKKYSKLKASLSRIPGARILHEREPRSGKDWEEGSDEEAELPDWDEGSRSYYLFFVSPVGESFEFETDTLEPDEDGIERRFVGQGWMGWAVGISVIAPFAAVKFDQLEIFENGSRMEPDIEPHMFNLDGGRFDWEKEWNEVAGEEVLVALKNLRAKIVQILQKAGITVIPEVDLKRAVPWLRAGEDALIGQAGEPITVEQAFFFRSL